MKTLNFLKTAIIFSSLFSLHSVSEAACIGNEYEQQDPLPNITLPTVQIDALPAKILQGQSIELKAKPSVNDGGYPFFVWCADAGVFEETADSITNDYATVKFTAPNDAAINQVKIVVLVGDTLGYINVATTIVPVQLITTTASDPRLGKVTITSNLPSINLSVSGTALLNGQPIQATWSPDGVSFNLYKATGTTIETFSQPVKLDIRDVNRKEIYVGCFPFKDVCSGYWYTRPIMKLWKEGVIEGYNNGKSAIFGISNGATRAEFIAALVRALEQGKTPDPLTVAPFADVSKDIWYAPYIEYAKKLGLIQGCDTTKNLFCPDKVITRAEAIKILVLAYPHLKALQGKTPTKMFSDVTDKQQWFYSYIYAAQAANIIGGYKDGTFRPNQPMNRAEMAKVVCAAAYGVAACIESGENKEIPQLAKVTSVSPLTATLGQLLKISVIGENLPDTTALWIANCSNVVAIGGTAQKRDFECTSSNDQTGSQEGVVKDKPDGTILSNFNVNVSKTITGCTTPTVSSVSPLKATLNQNTTFTVNGSCLTDATAFFIPECASLANLGGSETQRQFQCTPSYTTGIKEGVVKDKSGGTTLLSFSVNVDQQVATCTTPTVSSVSPLKATLNQNTTFTVNGNCLTDTTAFWIGECANLTNLGGTETQRQYQCTPSYTAGIKEGVVKDKLGGAVLLSFNVDVQTTTTTTTPPITPPITSCTPAVSSVSPLQATLDELATFTVYGSCLPETTAVWIDECTNLVSSGGSETQRRFQCTPSTTGSKSGVVKDKSGGSTLYSFNVAVQ